MHFYLRGDVADMMGYGRAMARFGTFRGRASRAEFWQFVLGLAVLEGLTTLLSWSISPPGAGPGRGFVSIVLLVHLIPGLAVTARRLHDTGWSGWWQLLGIIPLGGFLILARACVRGTPGPNRFGPSPDGTIQSAAEVAPSNRPSRAEVIAEIERLSRLRSDGTLSEDEFAVMKAEALAQVQAR